MIQMFVFFFFSSRRRHTRWPRDWSSDVCSSDLNHLVNVTEQLRVIPKNTKVNVGGNWKEIFRFTVPEWTEEEGKSRISEYMRSEERRVGKECRSRGEQGE